MSLESPPESIEHSPDPTNSDMRSLHPLSVVFDLMSHGRQHLFPAGIAILGAASGNLTWMIIALITFLVSVARSVLRFLTLRFGVRDGEMVVVEGLIFRRNRTIPVKRIQNIDLVQNPLHRLAKVAEVRIETASGSEPEAYLRVITMDQVAQLRQEVFDEIAVEPTIEGASTSTLPPVSDSTPTAIAVSSSLKDESRVLAIPVPWLIKAGLASNRGLVLFGILIGGAFQFDIWESDDVGRVIEQLPRPEGDAGTILVSVVGVILLLVLLRIVGVLWYLLRFYGYQLVRVGDDLRISCGLFTKVSATVPRKRIQFISVHRPFLLRPFGLCSVRLETAGGAGAANEDASSTISRKWFVPVMPFTELPGLLRELRPQLELSEDDLIWKPVSSRAARRLCRIAIIRAVVIGLIGLAIYQPWGIFAGLVLLPIDLYFAIRQSRAMRYARTSYGVAYRSGIFRRILSVTFFERVQVLRIDQSFFDRRWGMASLSVDTAGAGPAGHRIQVPYLDVEFANAEFEALNSEAAHNRPVWS